MTEQKQIELLRELLPTPLKGLARTIVREPNSVAGQVFRLGQHWAKLTEARKCA